MPKFTKGNNLKNKIIVLVFTRSSTHHLQPTDQGDILITSFRIQIGKGQ